MNNPNMPPQPTPEQARQQAKEQMKAEMDHFGNMKPSDALKQAINEMEVQVQNLLFQQGQLIHRIKLLRIQQTQLTKAMKKCVRDGE
jgi:hypothetical protein